MQKTVKSSVKFDGIGLHSGQTVQMICHPAPAGYGIVFSRIDLPNSPKIPARFDFVVNTVLNTRIANDGAEVSTIEHLMAALCGLGITNLHIDINGLEVPILDGSSQEFAKSLLEVGLLEQNQPVRTAYIEKEFTIFGDDGAMMRLSPASDFVIDARIDFSAQAIGSQSLMLNLRNGVFVRELANCRTFVSRADVDYLKKQKLALGGSLKNAVVVNGDSVENPEGFRRNDECVRHKILDMLGDLYLVGGPIIGHVTANRPGHGLTNKLLRMAFEEGVFSWKSASLVEERKLPGFDVNLADVA